MILSDLGNFNKDENYGLYYSEDFSIPILNNMKVKFVLDMFDDFFEYKQTYIDSIHNLLRLNDKKFLNNAEKPIYDYYKDMEKINKQNNILVNIKNKKFIWEHIKWGNNPTVTYREKDKIAYISFECECDWEIEHGLQIVLKNGETINKIGPYDGHLTNSDAFGKIIFENKVYISQRELRF